MTGPALAGRDVLGHAIHRDGNVRAVRAIGGEPAHPEAVAGIALIDVVGDHAR